MRTILCSLMLASLAIAGGQEGPANTNVIALYNQFTQEPPAAVKTALEDELDTIMGPLGLRFEWRDLHAKGMQAPTAELAVISFKGRCDVSGLNMHEIYGPGPLGWTHISDGQILPYADIDCAGLRGFLERSLLKLPVSQREEAFGRAIGRVLAHELYHIFADTTRHGSCGVAKEAYTVDDLMATNFRFEARESKALRESKASAALEGAVEQR